MRGMSAHQHDWKGPAVGELSKLKRRRLRGIVARTCDNSGQRELETSMQSCKLIVPAMVFLLTLSAMNALAQETARGAPLRIFDATELTPDRYTVIKRIWVDNWRSAFWIPAHSDSSSAIAALTAEAARSGADAVIHLACLNDEKAWLNRGYFCYGLAIKLKG